MQSGQPVPVSPGRPPDHFHRGAPAMSFVTVFTVSTMGFALVPCRPW